MASLSDFFKLSKKAPSGPFLRPLNRMLASWRALAPFCSSSCHLQQRQCPTDQHVYATDVCLAKGAICKTCAPTRLVESLWQAADVKGHYTKLESPERAALSAYGVEPLDYVCPDSRSLLFPGRWQCSLTSWTSSEGSALWPPMWPVQVLSVPEH